MYLLLMSGPCDALERVLYHDGGIGSSRLWASSLTPGTWYVVATGYGNDHTGGFTLSVDFTHQGGADLCEDAEELHPTLEEPAVTRGSNVGAGHEYDPHRSDSPDVFYRFHLDQPTSVELLMTTAPSWDTYLYLFSGTCDPLEELARNDDWNGSHRSRIFQEQLDAGDYLVMATGYGDSTVGAFDLTITLGAAP